MKDILELQTMRDSRRLEVEAYRQLSPLQGTNMPIFYHTFYLPMPHTASSPPANPPSTPPPTENSESLIPLVFDYVEGIALEYIDGWSMEDITFDVDVSRLPLNMLPRRFYN
jgi:hypothetical protein